MNRLISQVKAPKNRLKITPTGRLGVVYLDAAFLKVRGYYRLIPIGYNDAWQHFWDVWDMYKSALKAEGLFVKKEKGIWRIHYRPLSDIKLDASITGFAVWGEDV